MNDICRRSRPVILLAIALLGMTGCASRPAAEGGVLPQAFRTAVADTIREVVAEAAKAYTSAECPK